MPIRYGARTDTERPPPNGAIWIAPALAGGHDANSGLNDLSPVATWRRAVELVPDHGTIVGRDGRWHEPIPTPWQKNFTVQNAPGERPELIGSIRPTGWRRYGQGLWVLDGWTQVIDPTPAAPGILDPAYPWACHALQVWNDSLPLERVGSIAEVDGLPRFCHDETNGHLWIGVDPEAGDIRVGDLERAFVGNRGLVHLLGITIAEFVTRSKWLAAVSVNTPGTVVEDVEVKRCSAAGLFVNQVDHVTVRSSSFVENGQLGGRAYVAEDLELDSCYLAGNNYRRTRTDAAAGAWKTDSRALRWRAHHNLLMGNRGHGLWADEYSDGLRCWRNVGKGGLSLIFAELCRDVVITGNWAEDMEHGVLASGSAHVERAKNTYVNCRNSNRTQTDSRAEEQGGYQQDDYRNSNELYIRAQTDPSAAMLTWHDTHGGNRRTVADVHFVSESSRFYRRALECGSVIRATLGLGVLRSFPTLEEAVTYTGLERTGTDYVGDAQPPLDDQGRSVAHGVPLSPVVAELLEFTPEEAAHPFIGWDGPERIDPTPDPGDPDMPPYDTAPVLDAEEALDEELAALIAEVRRLEAVEAELVIERDDAIVSLGEAEAEVARLNGIIAGDQHLVRIHELEQQLFDCQVALWNSALLVNELRATVTNLNAQIAALNADLGTAHATITTLENEITDLESEVQGLTQTVTTRDARIVELETALAECQASQDEARLIVGGSDKNGYPDLENRLLPWNVRPGSFTQFISASRLNAADETKLAVYVAHGVIPSLSFLPGTDADTDYNISRLVALGYDTIRGGYSIGNEPTQKPTPATTWRARNIYAASVLPDSWTLVLGPFQRVDIMALESDPRFIGKWLFDGTPDWITAAGNCALGVNVYDKNQSVGSTFEQLVTATGPGPWSVEAYAQHLGLKLWIREAGAPEAGTWNRPAGWKPNWYQAMYDYCSGKLDLYELVNIFNSDVGGDPPPEGWWAWTSPAALAAYAGIIVASQT